MVLSDEDIIRLYQDPKFLGSFSGASNLHKFLFTDYGEVRQVWAKSITTKIYFIKLLKLSIL